MLIIFCRTVLHCFTSTADTRRMLTGQMWTAPRCTSEIYNNRYRSTPGESLQQNKQPAAIVNILSPHFGNVDIFDILRQDWFSGLRVCKGSASTDLCGANLRFTTNIEKVFHRTAFCLQNLFLVNVLLAAGNARSCLVNSPARDAGFSFLTTINDSNRLSLFTLF